MEVKKIREKLKNRNALIVLPARDFNETEFGVVKEKLTAAGISIFIASDTSGLCVGGKGMKIKADVSFYNINSRNFDAIVIIGGKGILNYADNENLLAAVRSFNAAKKIVSSICAAAVVLAHAGVLNGVPVAAYPETENELTKHGAEFTAERVAVHKNIITGKDPSAAGEFADALNSAINYLKV